MKPGFFSNGLQFGLLLMTPFLVFSTLLITGAALFLWVEAPQRLAGRFIIETNVMAGASVSKTNLVFLAPQPQRVTPSESNLHIVDPPFEMVISGAATNLAVWANGVAFSSGRQAAWHLFKTAWPLYLLTATSLLVLKYGAKRDRGPRPPGN